MAAEEMYVFSVKTLESSILGRARVGFFSSQDGVLVDLAVRQGLPSADCMCGEEIQVPLADVQL